MSASLSSTFSLSFPYHLWSDCHFWLSRSRVMEEAICRDTENRLLLWWRRGWSLKEGEKRDAGLIFLGRKSEIFMQRDSDSNHLKMFLAMSRELDVCWQAECVCLVFSFCIFKLISSFQGGNLILFDCFVIMELLKRMFLRVFTHCILMQLIQVLFFSLLLLTALEAAPQIVSDIHV